MPLDDTLDGYRFLLDRFKASNIALYGSAAGANLVAACTLKARDQGLPLPAAVECARVMRRHPVSPKIVALLGDDDESYRESAAAAGADAAVGKGRLSEALLPLLDQLFPKRSPQQ